MDDNIWRSEQSEWDSKQQSLRIYKFFSRIYKSFQNCDIVKIVQQQRWQFAQNW